MNIKYNKMKIIYIFIGKEFSFSIKKRKPPQKIGLIDIAMPWS
jgi:hypothetical protein